MAKRIINYTRLNINLDKKETLHALDNYKDAKGISRSKAVSQILDACVPTLREITNHHNSAIELDNWLLNKVHRGDIPRQRTGVAAEKHCLSIWHDKLQSGLMIDFDRNYGGDGMRAPRLHTRRDNGIGLIERRNIEGLCQKLIGRDDINYAVFIYFERDIFEHEEVRRDGTTSVKTTNPAILPRPAKTIKSAVGNGIVLLAKDCFYDEFFFNFDETILINLIELIPFGINGVTEACINSSVFCWVPLLAYNNKVVFVPVYKVNPLTRPTLRRPNSVTVVHSAVNSQFLT